MMKKDLLKKMKYEMPGMPKEKAGSPMDEEMEVEITMGPEEEEETGMPEMPEEEMAMADLSSFSDAELQDELERRKKLVKA